MTLAGNVMQFGRLLRRAGLPVGPADVLAGQQALGLVAVGAREEVRAALRATLVHRHEHRVVFDAAFDLFWQLPLDPAGIPSIPDRKVRRPRPAERRVAEALGAAPPASEAPSAPDPETGLAASARERLQSLDFEQMSAAEIAAAKAEMRRLVLPLDLRRTRRLRVRETGAVIDLRATLRASLRQGGEIVRISRADRLRRPYPLVVLCDISGSMTRYAQMMLFFLHAVANGRERVEVFLFGTRLSNITRQLRHRDPEVAFQTIARVVPDWSGGTRIADSIAEFNRLWSRRVLGQGAVVMLVTDGLDRPPPGESSAALEAAMDRLHRSARRLIWLNPLLRWSGFEPRATSIRAMLPHVDQFLPVHSLDSLRDLVRVLSQQQQGAGTPIVRHGV